MQMNSDVVFNQSLALDWLTQSGIQDENGGFYAWYRIESNEYSFLYPEITAYAIQLLCKIHLLGNAIALPKAIKAGNWLLANQNRDGSFFCKQYHLKGNLQNDESFFVFDAGAISRALFSLYRLSLDKKYLDAALKTLTLILSFQNTDGSFNAGRAPNGDIINNGHWSQTSSCHHLKLLIPFLQAYQVTLSDKYVQASKKLLDWGLNLQLNDGRFVEFSNSERTYTHAHCYATEGLLGSSWYFDGIDSLLRKRIQNAINWLLGNQNSDGSFYNWNDTCRERIKVSESVSQALRLFLLTSNSEFNAQFNVEDHVQQGFIFLKRMQLLNGNKRALGGIVYGESDGKKLRDVSTCSTIFALHAAMLQDFNQKRLLLDEII